MRRTNYPEYHHIAQQIIKTSLHISNFYYNVWENHLVLKQTKYINCQCLIRKTQKNRTVLLSKQHCGLNHVITASFLSLQVQPLHHFIFIAGSDRTDKIMAYRVVSTKGTLRGVLIPFQLFHIHASDKKAF